MWNSHTIYHLNGNNVIVSMDTNRGSGDNDDTQIQERPGIDATRLAAISIFESVSQAELQSIAKQCRWARIKKGKPILFQNSEEFNVVMICDGQALATTFTHSGKEVSYDRIERGQICGELAAIDHMPRTTHVLATEDCVIASMRSNDFLNLMTSYPAVSLAITRNIVGMVRKLCRRVYEFSALSVNWRIELGILRIAESVLTTDGHVVIETFPTHEELASRVSTHREAVTKHINAMESLGLIDRSGRKLEVLNIDVLRARIENALSGY